MNWGSEAKEKRNSCCFVMVGKKFFSSSDKPWWNESQRKKNIRNLYSEIVFMCAIIISNGYVCVPSTSRAGNHLSTHLFDFSSSRSSRSRSYCGKSVILGSLSDDKLHTFPFSTHETNSSSPFAYLLTVEETSGCETAKETYPAKCCFSEELWNFQTVSIICHFVNIRRMMSRRSCSEEGVEPRKASLLTGKDILLFNFASAETLQKNARRVNR